MKNKIIMIILTSVINSQNIDMYLSLIHEGQSDGVEEILPELISKYPNDPGVIYLKALLTEEALKSLELYSSILKRFPESKYSGEAAVKIGEYFYAKGLYSQAGAQLSPLPRKYPRLANMQQVLDMMISSFIAVGQNDSVNYYLSIYQNMFPNLDTDKYGLSSNQNKPTQNYEKRNDKEAKPYLVQIGAFSSIQNANRLKLQVNQIGYDVKIVPLKINGKALNAVRVVRFKTKSSAERNGNIIKKKLGIDYRVLYRPNDN